MADHFESFARNLSSPVTAGEMISPNDASDIASVTRCLFVGQSGDAVVTMASGDTITLQNLQAGNVYPIRVRRVHATGTTAGGLVGLS